MWYYINSILVCCFPNSESNNEYERVIDSEGLLTFLFDPDTKEMLQIDNNDEVPEAVVDGQLILVYEGWKGCGCSKCKETVFPEKNYTSSRGSRRYHKLNNIENDIDFELSSLPQMDDSDDDTLEDEIKLKRPVKSCFRRKRDQEQDSDHEKKEKKRGVRWDNELDIAWTHKKEKYERSFYPPSMLEAKIRSESIAKEVQELHEDLFNNDGSNCFAMAVRKARIEKSHKQGAKSVTQ
eukprot:CFRG5133T1